MKPNPEYQNAPCELMLTNLDGVLFPQDKPLRFRSKEDYEKYVETGDLKYSIPPYIP